MAAQKLTPRQRMINMMYLVLTALLALNVSKEIINAFVTVNDSIEVSNKNTTAKNSRTYSDFEKAMKNDPVKTKPFYDGAMTTKKASDALITYLDSLKVELIRQTDNIDKEDPTPPLAEMGKKDDYDVATYVMCGSENDGRGFEATRLKEKLNVYKQTITKSLPAEDQKKFNVRFDELLDTRDPDPSSHSYKEDNKKTWEMKNFYHNPVVATEAMLTKFQADIKNAESEVINHLYQSVTARSYKFDTLQARVIAPTSYVLIGQKYTADVFLAAMSSTSDPKIMVGDIDTAKKTFRSGTGTPIPVSDGLGKYEVSATSEGIKKWGGIITVKNPATNIEENYAFTAEYVAAKPSTVISADKMNVLYIGVENPMSISVPGVANELVTASISGGGGSLGRDPKQGGGHYIAKVTTQGEATINVTAKMDSKNMPMGNMKYRVKRVPDPVAKCANSKGGPINKNLLAAQPGIVSIMENFDFELYFKVKSFRMTMVRKGRDPIELGTETNLLTSQMKELINTSPIGTKVYFEYIRASGPDGTTRSLNPLNFVLN